MLWLISLALGADLDVRWVRIGTSPDGDQYYADPNSIHHAGNLRLFWMKVVYPTRHPILGIYSDSMMTADCGAQTIRVNRQDIYDRPGVLSQSVPFNASQGSVPIDKGTITEVMFNLVCPGQAK